METRDSGSGLTDRSQIIPYEDIDMNFFQSYLNGYVIDVQGGKPVQTSANGTVTGTPLDAYPMNYNPYSANPPSQQQLNSGLNQLWKLVPGPIQNSFFIVSRQFGHRHYWKWRGRHFASDLSDEAGFHAGADRVREEPALDYSPGDSDTAACAATWCQFRDYLLLDPERDGQQPGHRYQGRQQKGGYAASGLDQKCAVDTDGELGSVHRRIQPAVGADPVLHPVAVMR